MTKRELRRYTLTLFLFPGAVYIIVTRIVPLFYTIFISLTDMNLISNNSLKFVGIQNYLRIFLDDRFSGALGFTVLLTALIVSCQLLFGLLLALIVDSIKRSRGLFESLFLVPLFIPPVAVGTIWYILFNSTIGPINQILLRNLSIAPLNWLGSTHYALISIIITDSWEWTPFIFLIIFAALQNINPELYEAGKVDGASSSRLFFGVTLPLITKAALIAAILRALDAFRIFDVIYVLTHGGPGNSTESVGILIYRTAFNYFKMGYASSMAIVLLVLLAVIYLSIRYFLQKMNYETK